MTVSVTATEALLSVRRAAGPADWPVAAELLLEYAEWIRTAATFDPFEEQPGFADELDDLAGHYSRRDTVLFLAFQGELAVGTLAASCRPGRDAELKRMYVRPYARGAGIADALLAEAATLATRRRCTHLWLESVRGAMDPAIAVYRRNGFSLAEDATPTIGVGGVVVMRRELVSGATTPLPCRAPSDTGDHGGRRR